MCHCTFILNGDAVEWQNADRAVGHPTQDTRHTHTYTNVERRARSTFAPSQQPRAALRADEARDGPHKYVCSLFTILDYALCNEWVISLGTKCFLAFHSACFAALSMKSVSCCCCCFFFYLVRCFSLILLPLHMNMYFDYFRIISNWIFNNPWTNSFYILVAWFLMGFSRFAFQFRAAFTGRGCLKDLANFVWINIHIQVDANAILFREWPNYFEWF